MPKETVYTHGHHESVLRSHQWRTAANSAAYLLSELRPGQDLLDVGCGLPRMILCRPSSGSGGTMRYIMQLDPVRLDCPFFCAMCT